MEFLVNQKEKQPPKSAINKEWNSEGKSLKVNGRERMRERAREDGLWSLCGRCPAVIAESELTGLVEYVSQRNDD